MAVGGERADKRLGQHFLHERGVLERLAAALPGVAESPVVVEIGPGPGALTQVLLAAGYQLRVVEKDPRWQARMGEIAAENGGFPVLSGDDALTLDWPALMAELGGCPVIGNLPYNVGTEIVVRLILLNNQGHVAPERMIFMLQKEVVARICAQPGSADWGRLGVLCDLLCERKQLFDVGPGAFSPPPKVTSTVVRLTPLPAPRFACDLKKLDVVLRAGFGQRRKMLRASLRGLISEERLESAGIAPTARPETLSTQQFCALAALV